MLEKTPEVMVRPSSEADVPAMLAIYAHHIQYGLGQYERSRCIPTTSSAGARTC
jgi:L-amino acid N-acyltransferase YncA